MTKITWDNYGERLYETGIDRGVLYLKTNDGTYPSGVVWNGLTAVKQNSSESSIESLYVDNVKYYNLSKPEDFTATIDAYMYPEEFMFCDGSNELIYNQFTGQTTKKEFGLAYRTIIGNDVDAEDHGYKLHFIYNALASPSDKPYSTINNSQEIINFSWEITTSPVWMSDSYPVGSHFVVDSTKVNKYGLATLESILYGIDTPVSRNPRLPLPYQIVRILSNPQNPDLSEIFTVQETQVAYTYITIPPIG